MDVHRRIITQAERPRVVGQQAFGTVADDKKTARQKAYVKETLTRAFDEVKAARRGETKMMTEEEFLEGLKAVHVC